MGKSLKLLGLALILLAATACQRQSAQSWALTDIDDHLPDLEFTLAVAGNPHLTAADFRGKIVLLYFGYRNCPDVCPMTMSRLGGVLHQLGDAAKDVRLLFVSVDPKRDTPESLAAYAKAFSPEAVGATGSPAEIETIAKRYRVAYQADQPDRYGNYNVMHSKAAYIFDRAGHARLMITDTDPPKAIAHDLRQLIDSSS
ncbi:MAG TPA: SCO family protein [Opitutus sp.]|nr:SCO family protein [Opitutus sp.]